MSYLEEIKRSLTSLQVAIRSVVSDSNSQAGQLHDAITKLKAMVEVSGGSSCTCFTRHPKNVRPLPVTRQEIPPPSSWRHCQH